MKTIRNITAAQLAAFGTSGTLVIDYSGPGADVCSTDVHAAKPSDLLPISTGLWRLSGWRSNFAVELSGNLDAVSAAIREIIATENARFLRLQARDRALVGSLIASGDDEATRDELYPNHRHQHLLLPT